MTRLCDTDALVVGRLLKFYPVRLHYWAAPQSGGAALCIVAFLLPMAVAAGAIVATTSAAVATEGGQSPYLKGYRDFMSGVLPPPGVQLRYDLNFYSGHENSRIPQGQLATSLRSISNILGIVGVAPAQLWGGNYGFAIRVATTELSADRTVTNGLRRSAASGSLTGLNDLVVSPFVLGWHHGDWHWNVSASVWLPAGNYQATRLANTGRNYWSWSPQFAVTYLDREAGIELSAAFAYVASYENTATQYRSGDVAHADFAAMKRIAPRLSIGAVGYVMSQIADDSGAGAIFGARRAQVFGVGPAIRYVIRTGSAPVFLSAKYYREFSARNTAEGDQGALSLRVNF